MRANIILKVVFTLLFPVLVFATKAPDFTVTDFNNNVHKLYDTYLNKDKVLVIKFFFVGCPPCASIAPYVQQAYVRWGSGTGRVQFMEITTQSDYNSLVKSYHQTKGFTFPGIGSDGGAATARAPYTSGTFGPWYGTPTFVVISPNGDVNFNVPMTTTDQSQLDTAIARALRTTSGNGGGGGNSCTNAFSVKTITQLQPQTYFIEDLLNGNPSNEIKTGSYNCEFNLANNIDGYYVIPQMNATDNPLSGITTSDIVLIQRSILGLQTINNLQYAAADVNNNGIVSTSDVSEIRKLILGVIPKFTKQVNTYVVVHNPKSITRSDITDRVLVKDLVAKTKVNEFGVGKYGDVTGANLLSNDEYSSRSSENFKFIVEMKQLHDGRYAHYFYTSENCNLTAFQFEVKGNQNNILGIEASPKLSMTNNFAYNMNLTPDALRLIADKNSIEDIHISAGETWFTIYTQHEDRLLPGHFSCFRHEVLLDDAKTKYIMTQIEYPELSTSAEFISLSQQNFNTIVLNTNENIKSLRILDISGNTLSEKNYLSETKEVKVDNTSLPPGMYFASVLFENGKTATKKFIRFVNR